MVILPGVREEFYEVLGTHWNPSRACCKLRGLIAVIVEVALIRGAPCCTLKRTREIWLWHMYVQSRTALSSEILETLAQRP